MDKGKIWKCEECGHTTRWTYEQLANQGTPVCSKCDEDMEFVQ